MLIKRLPETSHYVVKAVMRAEEMAEEAKKAGEKEPPKTPEQLKTEEFVERLTWSPPHMQALAKLAERVNQLGAVTVTGLGVTTKDDKSWFTPINQPPKQVAEKRAQQPKENESLDDAFARLQAGLQ